MIDGETIKYSIFAVIWIYIFISFLDTGGESQNIQKNDDKSINQNKSNEEKLKIQRSIEKEKMALENLNIKKEEVENEIDKLKFEWSANFEKEAENSIKIRKLDLQVRYLIMNIKEKETDIYNLNMKLK